MICKTSLHKQILMFNTKYILYVSVLNFVSCFMFSIYLMHYISNFLCIISLTTKFVIYAVNFDWYREFIFNRCAIFQQSGIRNKGKQVYLLIICCQICSCSPNKTIDVSHVYGSITICYILLVINFNN